MNVNELLQLMIKRGISDIHFKAASPPIIRVNGKLVSTNFEHFTPKHIHDLAYSLMSAQQQAIFELENELDMSYAVDGVSRFRVNIYRQRNTVALTLRVVPLKIRRFEELNLPVNVIQKLAEESRGLILIAGITGAGKTTTMNSMVDYINELFTYNIVTVEDPIEFYHKDKKSTISQREVGSDTKSFKQALKHILRQDPDVVVIGEMREFEAISAGITAAETGHLVLSTIHTMDAVQTIDRIVDSYSPHQQPQVRAQLANVLKGIVAQRLLISSDGESRYPAAEILICTSLIRKLILEGKSQEIYKNMEQGDYYGMQTFDQDLYRLYRKGKITLEEALENATNPDDLMLKIRGIGAESGVSGGS
ncbi:MAG: type IV pilus twitching motility protein PilT [bacterium]